MCKIAFLPQSISIEVPPDTLISDAAAKAGVEDLHMPCGGKGTCGKCRVQIVNTGKSVLACQTRVSSDITVRLPKVREVGMRAVGDSHCLISEEFLPDGDEISPLYRTEVITVPPASIEEHYGDWQRLTRELTRNRGSIVVQTDISVLRSLAGALRESDGLVSVTLREEDDALRVVDVSPGDVTSSAYGVAIDIGTTTIAIQLVSLANGEVILSRTSYNAQISRGADVISRIDYAKTPERQQELRSLVLGTINDLIVEAADSGQVECTDIKAAFIAGNTTMVHLLLALPPRYIREAPYVPTVNSVPAMSASDLDLNIDPQANVAFAPGIGSYVGGDITAGLLCTPIPTDSDGVYLFLDIGTNGEIVLGNADWMIACACSAGPAFEGSGIQCGMRAAEGAIEYVEISEDRDSISCDVIGGGKPAGICGSGLICLLGELTLKGIVDQSGHFLINSDSDRLIRVGNTPAFLIERAEHTATGRDLFITESDIENLMRTKAAIYAACSLILSNVGLDWSVISRIYIAGGFGRFIQIEDAITTGLLPDVAREKFSYIGNSALTGAYIALLSEEKRRLLAEAASKITYIDLSSDLHYMDAYVSALFLPHTDMSQFPSVAEKRCWVYGKRKRF